MQDNEAKLRACRARQQRFATRLLRGNPISRRGSVDYMSLSDITQQVLQLVEARSGIHVHVEADPSLPGTTLATVVMARGKLALHRVSYRPDSSSAPDYLICQQAGFILRVFDAPPERRFDFAVSPEAHAAVERLVKSHPVAKVVPPQALPQLCQILGSGLLSHLRSIPVGMRVDRWLATDFPALAELQKASVLRQLQDSVATLAPQHRQASPQKIFDATQAISAAFASFWALRLNQPHLALPFKAAGFLQAGQELLAIWESTPDIAENDRTIIDAWAEKLGIAGWHQWVPYSAPK